MLVTFGFDRLGLRLGPGGGLLHLRDGRRARAAIQRGERRQPANADVLKPLLLQVWKP